VQTYIAHKLKLHQHLNGSRASLRLDGLPLSALRSILEYSTILGRLAISHTNRALRVVVHANNDILADLSSQTGYRGTLPPSTLRCLLEYTDDKSLKLAIDLPLQSSVMQHNEILLVAQPHLARTKSLYLGAHWGPIQLSITDGRAEKLRTTWRLICSFLKEPASQLERARITSGPESSLAGVYILPGDLFSGIAPLLRGVWLENVTLPSQPVPALSRIQDFCYSPHPLTLTAAQLRDLLQMMPELRALELYIEDFVPDSFGEPHTIGGPTVPLRVFRLEQVCSNMEEMLLQIQAAAGPNLRALALWEDGDNEDNPFWLDSVLAVYQRIFRIVMAKNWVELDLATDGAPEQVVVMRGFTSEDDPPPQLGARVFLSADRAMPGSLAWLTSLTMHEFLWPCDDTEVSELTEYDMNSWYPRLPALTDVELILGALDDYTYMFNEERICLMLADDLMGGVSMPRLARLTLSHRVRNREECQSLVKECTCERLLAVSLADLFELVEALKPESTCLKALILRGLDPVDLDLDVQLRRLGTLTDELQLVPLPDLTAVVSPYWSNLAWPEDPRTIFNLWADLPSDTQEISFLGH